MAAAQDEMVDISLFSGTFRYGKTETAVTLIDDHVSIGQKDARKISFQDILNAEVIVKKGDYTLTLHYIERRKPTEKRLKKANLILRGSENDCTVLQTKLKYAAEQAPGRPKNLLILINPKSGGSTGEKVYRKQVAPIFQLAGIKTEVRVTQRSGHMTELLQNEKLSNYDGIVVVGGDGTLHECLNGLIPIVQKEAGINVDDPSSDVTPVSIPIGLIPCGTGNGIAANATGLEVETCALSVIRGKRSPMNVLSIHSNHKLFSYSCLLASHGYFSDLIHTTERKRWMGRGRYPVVMMGSIFSKSRVFGAEVEFLPVEYEKKTDFKFDLETTDGEMPGWKKVKDQFTGVFYFNMEITSDRTDIHSVQSYNGVTLMLEKSYDRLAHFRILKKFAMKNMDMDSIPGMNQVNVEEFKVKLECDFSEDTAGAQNNVPPLTETLNIDGEIYRLPNPSFHVKFHKEVIQLMVLDERLSD